MKNIIEIGFSKDGDADFAITSSITELTYDQMNQFRAMCMVAIGAAESMWRRSVQEKNLPAAATPKTNQ